MTFPPSEVCTRCLSRLSDWERKGCACSGPRSKTNSETLYCVACDATGPLHVRDYIRIAARDFNVHMNPPTARMTLSMDRRFCWAGRGTYGLLRHGLVPGIRNLNDAARVMLFIAGRPLPSEVVHHCLQQFGYRYAPGSLRNAVARGGNINLLSDGMWDHLRSKGADRALRAEIGVVRPRNLRAWKRLRAEVLQRIDQAIMNREEKIRIIISPSAFGMNWE